ncbi:uncharacterized protein LOC122501838 [Leptopilina heterotoma]|uniref:uncharacterized protein LOC122501838 n=1 Tax=Leptopilina heterotoma TaxID=63436 RepID=UPI001CA8F66B|nr:uncharacterized protein LOC122501838 [Leptopilina heterotoma]
MEVNNEPEVISVENPLAAIKRKIYEKNSVAFNWMEGMEYNPLSPELYIRRMDVSTTTSSNENEKSQLALETQPPKIDYQPTPIQKNNTASLETQPQKLNDQPTQSTSRGIFPKRMEMPDSCSDATLKSHITPVNSFRHTHSSGLKIKNRTDSENQPSTSQHTPDDKQLQIERIKAAKDRNAEK